MRRQLRSVNFYIECSYPIQHKQHTLLGGIGLFLCAHSQQIKHKDMPSFLSWHFQYCFYAAVHRKSPLTKYAFPLLKKAVPRFIIPTIWKETLSLFAQCKSLISQMKIQDSFLREAAALLTVKIRLILHMLCFVTKVANGRL